MQKTDRIVILHLRFSGLTFNAKFRLSGVSCIECWELSSVSANIEVTILSVNILLYLPKAHV
jgi:hypothetical protein